MVRKLTAQKTIAVKDATYAVSKKETAWKKYLGYQSATLTENFLMRHFSEEHNKPR